MYELLIALILISLLELASFLIISKLLLNHFTLLIETIKSKTFSSTHQQPTSSQSAPKQTFIIEEDYETLKELSQFKEGSKEDVSIKLETTKQATNIDSNSQDALKFLKKKKD